MDMGWSPLPVRPAAGCPADSPRVVGWSESLDLSVPRMLSTVYFFSVASSQQSESDVVSLMEITCFKYDMDSVFHDRCFLHP